MSDYGFSIVFGRPLPFEFMNWFCTHLQPIHGVSWNKAESLHATIVNCTFPRGRSQKSEESVLPLKDELRRKFIDYVVGILFSSEIFEIEFQRAQCAGSSIILPSQDYGQIGRLKKALQGEQGFIQEEKAPEALARPEVVGRDKFSGDRKALQSSVSVTLGKSATLGSIATPGIPQSPSVKAMGLRVVFYRDRNLDDAEVSELLGFGASESKKRANIRRINEFFDKL